MIMSVNTELFKMQYPNYFVFNNIFSFIDFCYENHYTKENTDVCYDIKNNQMLLTIKKK